MNIRNSVVVGLISIFLTTVIMIGCLMGIVPMITNASNAKKLDSIKEVYVCQDNVFFDEVSESDLTIINECKSLLPERLNKMINTWTIVVADKPPFNRTAGSTIAGITYLDENIIWIEKNTSERVVLHEMGHAIDERMGYVSCLEKFAKIYDKYWNSYYEIGKNVPDSHSCSTTQEYFAALFADYIASPDYLKEHAPEAYNYFNELLNNEANFSSWTIFASRFKYKFNEFMSEFKQPESPTINDKLDNINVADNEFINITNCENVVDYSWMSKDSKMVIDTMFDMISNPDKYETENTGVTNQPGYKMNFDYPWTLNQYNELLSFIYIYFGDQSIDLIDVNRVNFDTTEVYLKKDLILVAEQNRLDSLKKVEEALASMHMGTESEMLIQIAAYIRKNSTFKGDANASFDAFWNNGECDDITDAMVFYQFANRLGIKCNIVCDTSSGAYCLFNIVELSNGEISYYNITRNIADSKQINCKTFIMYRWV